jgi:hypothetical protein
MDEEIRLSQDVRRQREIHMNIQTALAYFSTLYAFPEGGLRVCWSQRSFYFTGGKLGRSTLQTDR